MTGFGSGRAELGGVEARAHVVCEIRAVNHRHLDLRVAAPREIASAVDACESLVRATLTRGSVDVRLAVEGELAHAMTLDKTRAKTAYAALCDLAKELAPGTQVPLDAIYRVPDLFAFAIEADRDALRTAVTAATRAALAELTTMQAQEGEALRKDLATRVARMRGLAADVAHRQPAVTKERFDRAKVRLRELLADLPGAEPIAEERILREIALVVDRTDTTEEAIRLSSHFDQIAALLDATGDPAAEAGKRLDFLLQEIGREVGTLGAKAGDTEIARLVVEMKTETSKMREQAQNVL